MWRIVMFASSYVPLYLLFVVGYIAGGFWGTDEKTGWSLTGNVVSLVLIALSVVFIILLHALMRRAQNELEAKTAAEESRYHIERIADNSTPDLLNYLAVYFMPCLGMNIRNMSDCIVMLVVILVVGFIYIKTRATYLNPILLALGYYTVAATVCEDRSSMGVMHGPSDPFNVMVLHRDNDGLIMGHSYCGIMQADFLLVETD